MEHQSSAPRSALRPGNSPSSQRPPQQQQQQQQQQQEPRQLQQPQLTAQHAQGQQPAEGDPITRWGGIAKQVQAGLRSDDAVKSMRWPCMKLFLTGNCDLKDCRGCSSGQGRGDPQARAAAAKRLGLVLRNSSISPDLAKQIADGEKARA